ncbi:hypothetical protein ACFGVS_15110 [Mucilaginibacter sp. AW1-7]|jgi:hypothetical protein|uniref:hypothetical protein n=1 Tax=unclassified Mucilaginibacter TaxID=2617802 RepID=UPI0008BCDC75|nr:hypothetical protein [Mucilaginibacter sp. OK283]SEO43609.1 hypothetical protein SAMN05428947_102360 [Mucilaginibacter sp. OK283]
MEKRIYHRAISGIKIALFIIISCQWFMANAQALKTGSISYLTLNNGPGNNVVLGSDIKDLQAANLSYLDGDSRADADSCLRYAYTDPNVLDLGDSLNLDMVGIRAYRDKIVNIYLFFKMTDAYKVLQKFISMYGQFTDRPDNYSDIYNWNSSLLTLSLRYQYKADLGVAIFTSKTLQNEIAADKQRAISRDYSQALSLNN